MIAERNKLFPRFERLRIRRGPTARTGYPLFVWLNAIKKSNPPSKIHFLTEKSLTINLSGWSHRLAASTVLSRFARRNKIFTVADVFQLDALFAFRYKANATRPLLGLSGFGFLICDKYWCKPAISINQLAAREFHEWQSLTNIKKKRAEYSSEEFAALVIAKQVKIISKLIRNNSFKGLNHGD